jgi:nickel transport protein
MGMGMGDKMRQLIKLMLVIGIIAGLYSPAMAHSIHYQVENKGISARIFYSPDDPASYSEYEIFAPGDTIPHKKGRTDKNGFVSFLPDRKGIWIIKARGESYHGLHAVQIEISVGEGLFMESFKKPLIATYTKAFVGIGLIGWVFGAIALYRILIIQREKRKSI